jgi:multiple sugar transport system permease protein
LQPEVGFVNNTLWQFGVAGPGWLSDPRLALYCIVAIVLWGSIGGGRMIIFLAALQGVPKELEEACELDGGGAWAKFWNVTVPMLSPVIFFNLVLGGLDAFGVFAIAYVATEGGPNFATWFYMLHLVNQALRFQDMGYASALAWIFFVLVLIVTFIQVRGSRAWVYYAGVETQE